MHLLIVRIHDTLSLRDQVDLSRSCLSDRSCPRSVSYQAWSRASGKLCSSDVCIWSSCSIISRISVSPAASTRSTRSPREAQLARIYKMVICYNLRKIQMHHMHQPERKNFRSTIYEIDEPMRSWRVLTGAACTACSETCDNTTELCVYTLNVCTIPNIPLRCLYPSTCLAALLAQSLTQRLATARRTRYDDGTGACPGDV